MWYIVRTMRKVNQVANIDFASFDDSLWDTVMFGTVANYENMQEIEKQPTPAFYTKHKQKTWI